MPVPKFKAKKRPKRFCGTPNLLGSKPRSLSSSPGIEEGEETPEERPIPLETAKAKKMAISYATHPSQPSISTAAGDSGTESESESESDSELQESMKMKGYRVVHCETLGKVVSKACVCSVCTSPLVVVEDFAQRRGLVSTLKICCTNAECGHESKISDPYSSDTKSLNSRSVLAMREIGRGGKYMETFFGMMNMLPPVSTRSYMLHNQTLAAAEMSAAKANMNAASKYLHILNGVDPQDTLVIKVTCDGTWSRRGFTAIHGVVVVISYDTGQVLDFEVMSKSCPACSQQKTRLGEEEFDVWLDGHREQCLANHEGSSPAMECAGALILWKRSVETRHLRYTEVISDGDSKTISVLNEHQPYGSEVSIIKHECVGHVQKWLGKRVRAVKKELASVNKAPKERIKVLTSELKDARKLLKSAKAEVMRGRGRDRGRGSVLEEDGEPSTDAEMAMVACDVEIEELEKEIELQRTKTVQRKMLDPEIDTLQSLYRKAIVDHPGDLDGMTTACWAVYYHYISTDEDPQHNFCPDGEDSWCKYQQALATGQDPPSTHTLIPADYREAVGKVFEDLCHESLLSRCLLGATQNRNEAFNAMVWARCSKTDFSGTSTVQLATSLSVLEFNSGSQALTQVMDEIGIEAGPLCRAHLALRDRTHLRKASYVASEEVKQRRKSMRRRKKGAEEAHVEKEGVTYDPGGF